MVWQGSLCELTGNAFSTDTHSGNVDLTSIVPFLGKSQLQILSLVTSTILALAHTSTSWAVTERILLRDE